MKDLIGHLVKLGLSLYESRAYVALMQEFPANPYQVSKRSGVPTAKIYEVVARLEDRGLISKIEGKKNGYVPVDPNQAFGRWEDEYVSLMREVTGALEQIKPQPIPHTVWHIESRDGVLAFGENMIGDTEESLTYGGDVSLIEAWQGSLLKARERGVFMSVAGIGQISNSLSDLNVVALDKARNEDMEASVLVADARRALFVVPSVDDVVGTWTEDSAMVLFAEQAVSDKIYIRRTLANGWIPSSETG